MKKLRTAVALPDVCIIDINMKPKSGFDTLIDIKSTATLSDIKLLMLTMHDKEDMEITKFNEINEFFAKIKDYAFISFSLIFCSGLIFENFDEIIKFCSNSFIIHRLIVYNASLEYFYFLNSDIKCEIRLTNSRFESEPAVNLNRFPVNISSFSDAHSFSLYYNRKLIFKTALDRIESDADIFYTTRESIISKLSAPEYIQFSQIIKDDILVCNTCEYRYMCVDKRIPIRNDLVNWYYESECNYNQYICKWSNEEGYKTFQECGVLISKLKGIEIDENKLKHACEQTWGNINDN